MDMPQAEENLALFKDKIDGKYPVFPISAITRQGLRDLLFEIANQLEEAPEFPLDEVEEDQSVHRVIYRHEQDPDEFAITREDDGTFVVSGEKIERLFKMTDFSRDESVLRFSRQMRGLGVDEALRKRGAKDGDTIRILKFEFEFIE